MERAKALAAPGDAADVAVPEAREPVPAKAVKVPVARPIVPHFGAGMTVEALALDYRRIVELVDSGPQGTEGVSAKGIAPGWAGLELVSARTSSRPARWWCGVPSGPTRGRQIVLGSVCRKGRGQGSGTAGKCRTLCRKLT